MHADVLFSYSWSTNVCGIKRWYLIPPEYTYLLKDCFGTNLAPHLHIDCDSYYDTNTNTNTYPKKEATCENETFQKDEERGAASVFYPGLQKVREHAIQIVQYPGETIFVPAGWYHTVENLQDTLSINHNWINGTNIYWSWQKLKSEMEFMNASSSSTTTTSNPSLVIVNSTLSSSSSTSSSSETIMSTTTSTPTPIAATPIAATPTAATPTINSVTVEKNNTSNAVGQIGDDLFLLWKLISIKAQEMLSSSDIVIPLSRARGSDYESFSNHPQMHVYNLSTIVPILEWFQDILKQGLDHGVSQKCECNPAELLSQIGHFLSQT